MWRRDQWTVEGYSQCERSPAVFVSRAFAARSHVLIIRTPLFGLKVRIEKVRRIEVGAGQY